MNYRMPLGTILQINYRITLGTILQMNYRITIGTILQANFGKMTVLCSFSHNSFVTFHRKKSEPQHDCVISKFVLK